MEPPSVFPHFRHSVDDVPTEDWTIEEVIQWSLLQSHKATDEKYQQLVERLQSQFERGVDSIWQAHNNQATKAAVQTPAGDNENQAPNPLSAAPSTAAPLSNAPSEKTAAAPIALSSSATADESSKPKCGIQCQALSGLYAGHSFHLLPTYKTQCPVGRSRGKKVRQNGISLSKDPEVSTNHGRFEKHEAGYFYMDVGSTNGTKVNGKDIDPHAPVLIESGMKITCGTTVFEITILDDL